MMLDQHQFRGFADHGPAWNDTLATTAAMVAQPLTKGVLMMMHLFSAGARQTLLLAAAILASGAFVGIAVLPAALATGLAA